MEFTVRGSKQPCVLCDALKRKLLAKIGLGLCRKHRTVQWLMFRSLYSLGCSGLLEVLTVESHRPPIVV